MATLPTMHRSGTAALIVVLLAVGALLVATGPAAAHSSPKALPPVVSAVPEIPAPEPPMAAPAGPPDSPGVPAWVVAGGVLLGLTLARRRPRRALVLALILLLTIFVFENALHSVHHGFDANQYDECAIAAASAHLSAVSVDSIGLASLVLAVIGEAADTRPTVVPTRFLSPDQGRAPPSAIL